LRQYQIYKEPTPVTRNWQAQKTLIPPCWKCFQEHRIDAVNLDFGLCRSRCLLTYVRQTQRDKQAPLFGALDQDPDTD